MNNPRKIVFGLIALSLTVFMSCLRESSDSVEQDKIFTEYTLLYDGTTDKTFARATFKFSNIFGTKLELSGESNVTFNGDQLTFKPALADYEKEYAGVLSSGTFVWQDLDGNTFTNEVSNNVIGLPEGLDTIDRANSFELIFEGDPIQEKELVTVFVNGENELDAQTFITNDVGAQSIILAQNKLADVGEGPGTIIIERAFLPDLVDQTSVGGVLAGKYRPKIQNVYFK